MKRKLVSKLKQLEKEIHELYEQSFNDNSIYEEAKIRESIKTKIIEIRLLEELLGVEEGTYSSNKVENKIIFEEVHNAN